MAFKVGTDVFVREPQRFIPDCTCIVGPVIRKRGSTYFIAADIGRMGQREPSFATMWMMESDIGRRLGTPISKISTQPGTPGYAEWLRISRSWGH